MTKTNRFAAEKQMAERLACGRSMDEQIQAITEHGNHGAIPVLRSAVLAAHGIANPRAQAENGIFFGCYRPFTTPFLLSDYLKLLDFLGVDYTFFDREYCCGMPLLMQSMGDDSEIALSTERNAQRLNQEIARKKGASTMAYCCISCAYVAKNQSRPADADHKYILDLIFSALEGKKLKIEPTTVGYFEGCHSFYSNRFPDVEIDWKGYRDGLERIEGLKIVDLPNTLCCKRAASKIVDSALKQNLDTIVCSCNGCYAALKTAAKGKARMLTVPELLSRALGL
jgi:Fe-S oxidoreductase